MLPFYSQFQSSIKQGKILAHYPILTFPTQNQIKQTQNYQIVNPLNSSLIQQDQSQNSESQRSIFNQLNNSFYSNTVTQQKIHQILDHTENYGFTQSRYEPGSFLKKSMVGSSDRVAQRKWEKVHKQYKKLEKQKRKTKKQQRKQLQRRGFKRPKKAKSAYNLFVQDVVPKIKAQNPSFSAPDLVRVAAKMYNQLTQEQKVPYQKRYLLDKQRFDREREEYFRLCPQMDYRNDKKKPQSAYNQNYVSPFQSNYINF